MRVEYTKGKPLRLSQTPEIELEELLLQSKRYQAEDIPVANKLWAVVVVAVPGTFEPQIVFVVLGGVIIFVASLCLAVWTVTNTRRIARDNAEKARSEAEKTALILDNAQQAAKAERELVRSSFVFSFSIASFADTKSLSFNAE
jgi:hypothetical protein